MKIERVNKLKIESVDFCFDGGTAKIKTDEGTFYVNRSLSTGDNRIYTGTPNAVGSRQVSDGFAKRLLEVLKCKKGEAGIDKLIRDIQMGPPLKQKDELENYPEEIQRRVKEGRAMREKQKTKNKGSLISRCFKKLGFDKES